MNSHKKEGKFILYVLSLVLSILLFYWLVFFGTSNLKYFTFVYLAAGVVLLFAKIPLFYFKRARLFYFFMLVNLFLLILYLTDSASFQNIAALLISYLVIYYIVAAGMTYQGETEFENGLFKIIKYLLLLSFIISPILTYFKLSYAPDYYPWEALFSENRFLLITGNGVGHSNAMWLIALTISDFIRKIFDKDDRSNKIILLFLILLLSWCLIETKSRTALLFIIIFIFTCACYLKIFSRRIFAMLPILGLVIFFAGIFNPSFRSKFEDSIGNLQNIFPSLRILQSDNNDFLFYSGRDILNEALISEFVLHPWFGSGHSAPVLLYGVNSDGNVVSFNERKFGESESTLRILTKYGIIYFTGLLIFIFSPLVRAFRGYYRNNTFVISLCSIIIASGINGSIFENLYGISGLFAIILIALLIKSKNDNGILVSKEFDSDVNYHNH